MGDFCGCIYLLRCLDNNKTYVGQTTNLKRRLYYHFNKNTIKFNNSPLYPDIVKYGREGFTVDILHEVSADSLEELKRVLLGLEKKAIVEYNSIEDGYNLELGNELTQEMKDAISARARLQIVSEERKREISVFFRGERNHNYGKPMLPQVKEALRNANLGKKRSAASIEKQREAMQGENNSFYGKTHTKKSRKKMSISRRGKLMGGANPSARKVRCTETGEVFDTMKDAGEWLGLTGYCNISSVCNGKLKTYGGYHWEYADEAADNG